MAEREKRRSARDRDDSSEFGDRLVAINRVSKTVKGGKRFGFAALVVVGDQRGRVGFGKGKAKEVPEAIRKATENAKRRVMRVPLREGRTLHHDIEGRHGAGKVVMRTASEGTGIIAGGPMRAVFEVLGIKDVVAKSLGSQNPYNMIRATVEGLKKQQSPRLVALRRGKAVSSIHRKRNLGVQETLEKKLQKGPSIPGKDSDLIADENAFEINNEIQSEEIKSETMNRDIETQTHAEVTEVNDKSVRMTEDFAKSDSTDSIIDTDEAVDGIHDKKESMKD